MNAFIARTSSPIVFTAGAKYCISTEKQVDMLPDCPHGSVMVKRSTYPIRVLEQTPTDFSWWIPTGDPHIVLSKAGKKYLLAELDKSSGIRGSSEFINPETGDVFSKRDVKQWLPEQSFDKSYFTLPFDTIRQADEIVPPTVLQQTAAEARGLNDLPF